MIATPSSIAQPTEGARSSRLKRRQWKNRRQKSGKHRKEQQTEMSSLCYYSGPCSATVEQKQPVMLNFKCHCGNAEEIKKQAVVREIVFDSL